METPLEPAIAIVRRSTKEQSNGMHAQEGIVRDYAAQKRFDVRCLFEDQSKPAEKIPFLKRGVTAKALAYSREYGIRQIIMPSIEHIFRDVEDCRETIRILTKGERNEGTPAINMNGIEGLTIHIVENEIDSRDEQCLLALAIRAKCAQEARQKRSKWIKQAHVRMREENKLPGNVPYGWSYVNATTGQPLPVKDRTGILVPHPEQQAVLHRLVQGDLSKLTVREAQRRLNAERIPSPGAGKTFKRTDPNTGKVKKWTSAGKWSAGSVQSVKRNPRLKDPHERDTEARPTGTSANADENKERTSSEQKASTPAYAQLHCPVCSKTLRLSLPLQGRLWNCPNCKARFSVAFDIDGRMATHIELPTAEPSTRRPWHEVLEVSKSASVTEIKSAFREAMKKNHPDKVAAMSHEFAKLAERKAKEINRAYEEALATRR